jgi:hypothetical protein
VSAGEGTLEGWTPEPGPDLPLGRIIDLAFDYRGNVTVLRRDGTRVEGYVSNRNADVADPFLELFDLDGAGPHRIRYAEVRTVHFTGRDIAAGKSYAAWLARRQAERAAAAARRS